MRLLWLRGIVRWLIGPLVRWAQVGYPDVEVECGVLPCGNHVFFSMRGAYGLVFWVPLDGDEAIKFGRGMLSAARDAIEGIPVEDEE